MQVGVNGHGHLVHIPSRSLRSSSHNFLSVPLLVAVTSCTYLSDLFVLPLTIFCLMRQLEKCWCTVLSVPGSTCLEFTAIKDPRFLSLKK